MSVLQVWLVVGVPGLVLAGALFYGRSRLRSRLGYLVMLATFAGLTVVDRASGSVVGILLALTYAAGRGGAADAEVENTSVIAVPGEVRRPVRHPAETS